ncbi:UNKNOWN [Stylonychia lemnae]|uniref:Uncharacterized protein n=1 Tax=Stylonychia lemnae TaxID=5949 RepID=A0A078B8Q7_STYLE|nr:UNKNOWN [Stylonychia lemnae]|eukprot:CDW90799.1 UNKNOWN [Stylonychia lemnae]
MPNQGSTVLRSQQSLMPMFLSPRENRTPSKDRNLSNQKSQVQMHYYQQDKTMSTANTNSTFNYMDSSNKLIQNLSNFAATLKSPTNNQSLSKNQSSQKQSIVHPVNQTSTQQMQRSLIKKFSSNALQNQFKNEGLIALEEKFSLGSRKYSQFEQQQHNYTQIPTTASQTSTFLNNDKSPIRKLNNRFRIDLDKRSITPIIGSDSATDFYNSQNNNNNLTASKLKQKQDSARDSIYYTQVNNIKTQQNVLKKRSQNIMVPKIAIDFNQIQNVQSPINAKKNLEYYSQVSASNSKSNQHQQSSNKISNNKKQQVQSNALGSKENQNQPIRSLRNFAQVQFSTQDTAMSPISRNDNTKIKQQYSQRSQQNQLLNSGSQNRSTSQYKKTSNRINDYQTSIESQQKPFRQQVREHQRKILNEMQNIRKEMRKISRSSHRQYDSQGNEEYDNNSIFNLKYDSDEESGLDGPQALKFIKEFHSSRKQLNPKSDQNQDQIQANEDKFDQMMREFQIEYQKEQDYQQQKQFESLNSHKKEQHLQYQNTEQFQMLTTNIDHEECTFDDYRNVTDDSESVLNNQDYKNPFHKNNQNTAEPQNPKLNKLNVQAHLNYNQVNFSKNNILQSTEYNTLLNATSKLFSEDLNEEGLEQVEDEEEFDEYNFEKQYKQVKFMNNLSIQDHFKFEFSSPSMTQISPTTQQDKEKLIMGRFQEDSQILNQGTIEDTDKNAYKNMGKAKKWLQLIKKNKDKLNHKNEDLNAKAAYLITNHCIPRLKIDSILSSGMSGSEDSASSYAASFLSSQRSSRYQSQATLRYDPKHVLFVYIFWSTFLNYILTTGSKSLQQQAQQQKNYM